MNIHKKLSENKNISLALGFFDGVHLAHQELIRQTVLLAKKNNIKSALITFDMSPSSIILNKEPIYITNLKEKLKLIENLGIDDIYVLDFNCFKTMRADTYIRDVLLKYF